VNPNNNSGQTLGRRQPPMTTMAFRRGYPKGATGHRSAVSTFRFACERARSLASRSITFVPQPSACCRFRMSRPIVVSRQYPQF
jgi:hypothetical protein